MQEIDYTQQPEVKSFGRLALDFPQATVLPSGAKLYVVNSGDQDVNKIEVAFRGGAFEEDKPLQATMMSSMLVHGSNTYSSLDVAEKLDFYGSWFGARCLDNHTVVTLHSLNRCLAHTLPMLVDLIFHPAFPEKEFELLRNKALSAYKTARGKVKYIATTEVNRMYFGDGHPLARDIQDSDIECIKIEDLRRFHDKYYHPSNCTIILSGKIGDNEIKLVKEAFGNLPESRPSDEFGKCESHSENCHFRLVDKPDAVQTAVSMIMPAIPRSHPDYIKLRVLVMAFGGYFGSRLMSNIREEKGYTYGISAMLLGRRDGANIAINSECGNQYVSPLIDEVKYEMARLQNELMPQAELEMVKSYMMSELVKTFDTPFAIASYVGSTEFFGVSPEYFNEQVDCIEHITPADLQNMAAKYLNAANLITVVAGDRKIIEPTLNRLKI